MFTPGSKRYLRHLAFCLVLATWAAVPASGYAQTGGTIAEVVVEGAQRIEPDTVRSYLLVRAGDLFDTQRIDRSLKSLFATGLFADVRIRRSGDALVVTVVENPVINRIAFEGNLRIDDETLEQEVSLRARVIYNRSKVQNDVNRVLTIYRAKGRFGATVEPKVIQLGQNRVDLVFEISEGELTEVERIRFVGNRSFSDSRLREIIRTKETRWYRIFSSDDKYDPDRLTLDRELLRQFYLNNGYADFRVNSAIAELTPDREDFFITFTVEEGLRYGFGDVVVEAQLRDLDSADVEEAIEIERGDWYDAEKVEETVDGLNAAVGTLGYAFVDVRARTKRDREERTIDVSFEINEGPRSFVERIDIEGNVRTVDEVIRREFRIVEGDAFNASKLRRSIQRIQDLNYFEKVALDQVPGSDADKVVIKAEVEEKSTGSFSVGAGFSSTYGPLGDISIRERNLLGRGQDLKVGLTIAAKQSEIDLNFTEPYFLGREVSAGFDVFRTQTDLQDTRSHDFEELGLGLRSGYPITEALSQGWTYGLKLSKVTDVDDSASQLIKDQSGSELISQISHRLTYDRRDSRIRPTDGYVVRLTNDLAGLGGSVQHFRNAVNAGTYYALADQWILSVTGTAGYIIGLGEDVLFSERFFIGGDNLRGFANNGVGPRDKDTDDALGGEWAYTGTVELAFPIGLPTELGVSGRVFTDLGSSGKIEPSTGNVNDTASLRAAVGTGITWTSPVGLIGFDFGVPVLKESFDETELFRVNFGTRF
jgi:outer membrane protein insertion porin family